MAEYIEREALMAELAKGTIITDDIYGMGITAGMDHAIKTVRNAPAADVAPVVPSWWECYETSAFGGYKDGEAVWWPRKFYRCERCRRGSAIRSNFCPNCGADMQPEGGADRAE